MSMRAGKMKFVPLVAVLIIVLLPDMANAADFVPCDGVGPNACSACHFATMANTIVKWLIGVLMVVFAVIATSAGFGLVTSGGNPEAKSAAKQKMVNAVVGLIIVLAGWLLVDTIIRGLLEGGDGTITYSVSVGDAKPLPWYTIECQPQTETIDYKEDDTGIIPPAEPLPPVPESPTDQLCYAGSGSGPVCFPAYIIPTNVYPYNYPTSVAPPKFVKYTELTSTKISKYYKFCDLTKCSAKIGDYVYLSPLAVSAMDKVTDSLGGNKLTINSGYRSPAYNATVGGAVYSQHTQGVAFDISASGGLTTTQIEKACKSAGAGFTKLYDTFTHCDWR